MKSNFLFILMLLPLLTFSQKLERNVFDYDKLKKDTFFECDESIKKELESAYLKVQENNSAQAVQIAKELYTKNTDCYQIFEVYGYVLFRSGEWLEGVTMIEKGINKFGSVPELIKRKSEMSLEMAELGTRQKNIDGNSVFKANSLQYDEEQFKEENLKSALADLEYLRINFRQKEETFYVAKIHQILKNYDTSTEIFKEFLNDEEYKFIAIYNIGDNYLAQNKFSEAEVEFNMLLIETPKEGQLYDKLAEVYEQKKESEKAQEFRNKAIYYNNIPVFSNLEYSKDNFELVKFFGTGDNKADKKIKKLTEIFKKNNQDYTIDVCIMILKLHANHGNGVEEKATEILAKIGKPAIEEVNQLFQTDVSTCTITNLAEVMATVKEESSWEIMKKYLAYIANMPMTLIPPNLPEKMIQFNEDRGVTEILTVVQPLLRQEGDLKAFGQYVYYYPLKKISKTKLKKIATELSYTDEDFSLLEEKIK